MILSDSAIKAALDAKLIEIIPYNEGFLSASSYDFHLSPYFKVFEAQKATCIDPLADQRDLWQEVYTEDFFVLHPGEFALASSIERFTFDASHAGRLEGKSSVARFGLIIHAAGFFDPGFCGYATLELSNPTSLPIKLYPGMVVGQMAFLAVQGIVEKPYGGEQSKYQDQPIAPAPSRYFANYTDDEGHGRMPLDDFHPVWYKPESDDVRTAPRLPDFRVARTDMEEEFVDVQAQVEHDLRQALNPIVPPYIGSFRGQHWDPPTMESAQSEDDRDPAPVNQTLYRTKSGRVLTDDDIERLADEAEAGYDVSHLVERRRRPDRP
jgi:dCTP deaminase